MLIIELVENLVIFYELLNNVLLVVLVGEVIIGIVFVFVFFKKWMEYIGEIGISILKEYWGYGLGSILMEEFICWVYESYVICCLELMV